jgi:formylglycine-generating enzyme required for sulfatase activity
LADTLQGNTELLGPMNRTEMTEAIEKPASLQKVSFEANLTDRLRDDVGEEEGSLPLLEFALTELWQYQSRHTLTHVAYEEIGEVRGALSRHADNAYQRLSETEKEQARRVFMQLVTPGAGTEDTRRLATRSELDQNWALVARLANERLVVTSSIRTEAGDDQAKLDDEAKKEETEQDTVEVVHEALIRHWQQLREWMKEDRSFLTWLQGLRTDLQRWQSGDGSLLQGASLSVAEDWLKERPTDLNQTERDYIEASLAQRQREERNRRLILVGTVVAAVVMAVLGIVSYLQSQAASAALFTAETAEANAVTERDNAAAAQATAEAGATAIAQQNEAAEAEVEFYESADPQVRIDQLMTLLASPGYEGRTAKLFWGLPTQDDKLALFKAEDKKNRLPAVIKALYITLADVNRAGYHTDPILDAMVEALEATGQAPGVKTELEQWQQVRAKAREAQDEATLTEYEKLTALNDRNPATLYEQAGVRVALGQYEDALVDLDRVMALVDNHTFATSGLVESGAAFATIEQVTQAVRRLIKITPEMGRILNNSASTYPHLQDFDLVLAPTPTPVTNDIDGAKMVLVPAGSFKMGSNLGSSHAQPVHEVMLDAFYIDQTEVTNAQYEAFIEDGGYQNEDYWTEAGWHEKEELGWSQPSYWEDSDYNAPNQPVVSVSWYEAAAFCKWRGNRLPTEAEWEKAARGMDGRTYPWGEHIAGHLARYSGSSEEGTAPVGHYAEGVSPYGAYDMAGNVWEWVADAYDGEYYSNSPAVNPPGPDDKRNRRSKVIRGGHWYGAGKLPRSADRVSFHPGAQFDNLGFRCVAVAP